MKSTTSYPKEKIKILLLEGVHPAGIELFKKAGYSDIETMPSSLKEDELMEKISNVHILGIRSKTKVTEKVFAKADKLLTVGCFCIGTNQVDMKTATEKGIAVFNSPFSNTRSVAELVIAETIMLMRKVMEKSMGAHRGEWLKDSKNCFEVRGKTIGIVGYGHIGAQVSVMAESLGMNVIFYDAEPKLALGNARQAKDLDELLSQSDVISLHVPGGPSTKNLINTERINKMKKGACIVNLSRGDIMDNAAVKKALEEGQLGGVGIDVFTDEPQSKGQPFVSPFIGVQNAILTPHIGGSTMEAQESIGVDAASKLISFVDTGTSVGSLSVPPLNLPVQHDAHRLLHIHKNVPGVLGEINSMLSGMNVNILGQYLKTNEKIGYVVVDVDKDTSADVMEEMKKVKNTIRVRSLY